MSDPGWYPDPSKAEMLRWWDGASWTEDTHAGDAVVSLRPNEPLIAPPTGAPTREPSGPAPQGTGPVSTGEPPRASRFGTPALGLAVLAVMLSAALIGIWVANGARDPDGGIATRDAEGGTAGALEPSIPPFIDQPWARTSLGSASLSFEFPITFATIDRQLPNGVKVTTISAGDPAAAYGLNTLTCNDADFAPPGSGPVDFAVTSTRTSFARSDLQELGIGPEFVEESITAVGAATRFGGTRQDPSMTVRGVVLGQGSRAIWCQVHLPAAQAALADLTLARILTTLAP